MKPGDLVTPKRTAFVTPADSLTSESYVILEPGLALLYMSTVDGHAMVYDPKGGWHSGPAENDYVFYGNRVYIYCRRVEGGLGPSSWLKLIQEC